MDKATPQSQVAQARVQLYVDDPAVTLEGTPDQQIAAVDLLVLWWLVLGIPLAWDKGSFCAGNVAHDWIGVQFWSQAPGTATMSVPKQFLEGLLAIALTFTTPTPKTASLKDAHALCGKAGRLAQVVPAAKPFVQQLFAALASSLRSLRFGLREAPPKRVAKRRYATAAAWLVGLLQGRPFALQHTLRLKPASIDRHTRRVEFDASPWGGAFVLYEGKEVTEWGFIEWTTDSAPHLGAVPALPKWQSFWELATSLTQRTSFMSKSPSCSSQKVP